MKKDKRMIVSIIWVVLGTVLIALAFAEKVDVFWNGMGSGLLIVGALNLLRQYRFSKNEAYREKIEIEEMDALFAVLSKGLHFLNMRYNIRINIIIFVKM